MYTPILSTTAFNVEAQLYVYTNGVKPYLEGTCYCIGMYNVAYMDRIRYMVGDENQRPSNYLRKL